MVHSVRAVLADRTAGADRVSVCLADLDSAPVGRDYVRGGVCAFERNIVPAGAYSGRWAQEARGASRRIIAKSVRDLQSRVWCRVLKLQQGQVWKAGDEFLRIVDLQRLEVKYKTMNDLSSREGTHHQVTKKEFCRLIKGATLLQGPNSGN
jgi:hypothetical protein